MMSPEQKKNIIDLCEDTYKSVQINPGIAYREAVSPMLDFFDNASYEIKNDKDIMLAAVKVDKLFYPRASDNLKEDVSFNKAALKNNPEVRDYLSPEMQKKVDAPAVKRPPFTDFAKAIEDAKARAAGQVVDKPNTPDKTKNR